MNASSLVGDPVRHPVLSLEVPLVAFGRVVVFSHGEQGLSVEAERVKGDNDGHARVPDF